MTGPDPNKTYDALGNVTGLAQHVDERGVPYTLDDKGQKRYISNGIPPKEGGGGLIHDRLQWDTKTGTWKAPISGSKLMTYATIAALTSGAANAAMTATPAVTGGAGVTAATPAVTAGATAAAPAVTGGSTVAGLLPSSSIAVPSGVGGMSAPSIAANTVAHPGGGGLIHGLWGGVKKLFGGDGKAGDTIKDLMGDAGAGINGADAAAAHNRGVRLEADLAQEALRQSQRDDYERQLIARSEDDRSSMADAFTKSVQANRVLNSTGYHAPVISQMMGLNGKPSAPTALPNFGTGMAAPTEQMKTDATGMYNEVAKRLQGGSQLPGLAPITPYTIDPKLLEPGNMEKTGDWLGPILTRAGQRRDDTSGKV